MKRKKRLAGATAVLLIAVSLVACASPDNSSSNEGASQPQSDTSNVTLRFSWWGGDDRHQATLAAIEAYKEVAPHVRIEAEYQGFDGYEQKVKTQLASSTAADIIQLDYPWMGDLSIGDFFVDLSAQSGIDLSGFDQEFLSNFGMFDGALVALPTGVNAYTVAVNKTAAEQNGVPTNITWDWDTLYEEGKALHEQDSSKYLMYVDHTGLIHDFTRIVKQRTGNSWVQDDYTIGFGREDALAGFAWIAGAFEAGVYQPLGEAQLFFGKPEQNPKWINMEIIMNSAMSSTLGSLKSVFDDSVEITSTLHPLDRNSNETAVVVRPSQVMAVNAKSNHVDEAVKFLDWFMNSEEAAVLLGAVRSVPASSSAQRAAVESGKIDPVVQAAVEMGLEYQGIIDSQVSYDSEVQQLLTDEIEKVAFDVSTPEQAADSLMAGLERLLNDLKNRQ